MVWACTRGLMKILNAFVVLISLAASAMASSGYGSGPTINTTTGKVSQSWAGLLNVAKSSGSISTPATIISGSTGVTIGGPNPWFDIMSPVFGAVADGSASGGTDNTNAIRAAIAAATATASGGGVVFIPAGSYYKGTSTIVVPQGVRLIGSGPSTSILYSAGSGYAIQLGSSTDVRSSGIEFSNLEISLIGANANGLDLLATVGADVHDLYIGQAAVSNPHNNICILIDGGNSSSFYNRLDTINCNHVEIGVKCQSSGTTQATIQHISNLNVVGDDATYPGNGSVGYDFGGTVGSECSETNIYGGNLESVTTGFYLRQNIGPIHVSSTRFEITYPNTSVYISSSVKPSSFFGLTGYAYGTITDLSGLNTFIGGTDSSNNGIGVGPLTTIQSPTINGSVVWKSSSTGHVNSITVSTDTTGNGLVFIQAGPITAAGGGSVIMYGNVHATHPGDIVLGISDNGDSKFRVQNSAVDSSSDVFTITHAGNTGIDNGAPTKLFQIGVSTFGATTAGLVNIGTMTVSAVLSPPNEFSLCLHSGALGHCTTTPTNGACTCVAQ